MVELWRGNEAAGRVKAVAKWSASGKSGDLADPGMCCQGCGGGNKAAGRAGSELSNIAYKEQFTVPINK